MECLKFPEYTRDMTFGIGASSDRNLGMTAIPMEAAERKLGEQIESMRRDTDEFQNRFQKKIGETRKEIQKNFETTLEGLQLAMAKLVETVERYYPLPGDSVRHSSNSLISNPTGEYNFSPKKESLKTDEGMVFDKLPVNEKLEYGNDENMIGFVNEEMNAEDLLIESRQVEFDYDGKKLFPRYQPRSLQHAMEFSRKYAVNVEAETRMQEASFDIVPIPSNSIFSDDYSTYVNTHTIYPKVLECGYAASEDIVTPKLQEGSKFKSGSHSFNEYKSERQISFIDNSKKMTFQILDQVSRRATGAYNHIRGIDALHDANCACIEPEEEFLVDRNDILLTNSAKRVVHMKMHLLIRLQNDVILFSVLWNPLYPTSFPYYLGEAMEWDPGISKTLTAKAIDVHTQYNYSVFIGILTLPRCKGVYTGGNFRMKATDIDLVQGFAASKMGCDYRSYQRIIWEPIKNSASIQPAVSRDFSEELLKFEGEYIVLAAIERFIKFWQFSGSYPAEYWGSIIYHEMLPYQAQISTKWFADKNRMYRVFEVGEGAYFKTRPSGQNYMEIQQNLKLHNPYFHRNDVFLTNVANLVVKMMIQMFVQLRNDVILCHVLHYPRYVSIELHRGSHIPYYIDKAMHWGLGITDLLDHIETTELKDNTIGALMKEKSSSNRIHNLIPPSTDDEGRFRPYHLTVFDIWMIKRGNVVVSEIFISRENSSFSCGHRKGYCDLLVYFQEFEIDTNICYVNALHRGSMPSFDNWKKNVDSLAYIAVYDPWGQGSFSAGG